MINFILAVVKNIALVGAIYFSAALAIQINLGGDVEYWLSLFIGGGILVYSALELLEKKVSRS